MGAEQSTASQGDTPAKGLHVLRVTPSSPASETDIEPFFDFVVGFEGGTPSPGHRGIDVTQLEKIVESHEGRVLNLLVWSSKSRNTRLVPVIPSREWSQSRLEANKNQSQIEEAQPSLLGLSMRMCQPEHATDNVWHVLDVLEGSPAESAGLVPMGDWILGWSGGALSAENDFYDLVEAHVDKPLRVYVYSYDFDTLREVVLIPNRHWGGEGLLGCVFGFGLLHRIPPQPEDRVPGSIPSELLEEESEEYEHQSLFVPADAQADVESSEWQETWGNEPNSHSTSGYGFRFFNYRR
ncbi:GRASP55/65 PDZ-like domain-containing protein [Coprinopsis sp. MPI-PUGE-AT-0042]|nr:GRASP55/65 PDZ-like domain-containing protein [Coprinopsis sp. MPI-PUGE-AT-0042]